MFRSPLSRMALGLSVAALVLALVPPALAGKGKPGGGGGGATTSGSFSLVLLDSTDGRPHWGQTVTFNVSTSASQPFVSLQCHQAGVLVYSASAGFFPSYPWSKNFSLASAAWTGGDADCVAQLYAYSRHGKKSVLAKMIIHVYA